ncbi:MAG: hypothetical protein H7Z19_17435, partial [Chitinophagaceae bacterium]|nr:hypothetical protein [Rubrivivax sp.]
MNPLHCVRSSVFAALALSLLGSACTTAPTAGQAVRIERVHLAGHGSVNSFLIVGSRGIAIV